MYLFYFSFSLDERLRPRDNVKRYRADSNPQDEFVKSLEYINWCLLKLIRNPQWILIQNIKKKVILNEFENSWMYKRNKNKRFTKPSQKLSLCTFINNIKTNQIRTKLLQKLVKHLKRVHYIKSGKKYFYKFNRRTITDILLGIQLYSRIVRLFLNNN